MSSLIVLISCLGCTRKTHSLGYNTTSTSPQDAATDTSGTEPVTTPDPVPSMSSGGGVLDAGTSSNASDETRLDSGAADADAVDADTVDTDVGTEPPLPVLHDPPNQFVNVLGLDPAQVDERINEVFEQLFFGNPEEQAVYVEVEAGLAYIYDVLHDDTRLDAMGYGMMTTVQLDRRQEFDSLWNYVQTRFEYKSGARAGYYRFSCAVDSNECDDAVDTFGIFYVATALLMAERRWSDDAVASSYGEAAREILTALRSKEEQNGGIVEGVLNVFDSSYLPRVFPLEEEPQVISTGAVLPPFFELWSIATGDSFWSAAAEQGRAFLLSVPNEQTGLTPAEVDVNYEPTVGFRDESYGTAFMLAVDHSWVGPRSEYVEQVNKLLGFFVYQGLPDYPALYELDGMPLTRNVSAALVALNGAAAGIAIMPERTAFIRAVWEAPTPTGLYRFYDGMNQLLSMLYLSGGLRSYH